MEKFASWLKGQGAHHFIHFQGTERTKPSVWIYSAVRQNIPKKQLNRRSSTQQAETLLTEEVVRAQGKKTLDGIDVRREKMTGYKFQAEPTYLVLEAQDKDAKKKLDNLAQQLKKRGVERMSPEESILAILADVLGGP